MTINTDGGIAARRTTPQPLTITQRGVLSREGHAAQERLQVLVDDYRNGRVRQPRCRSPYGKRPTYGEVEA